MGKYLDQSGLSHFLSKLLSIFVKKTDLMGGASSADDGHPGIVPTPGSGNQAKFLRGDATWATPTNTTYSAGAGITLDGIQFKHSNSVTSGTAGTSSATNAQNSLAVPYVTYDAQGHVTAAGTHTHTINAMKAATSAAAGSTGLVPAPASGKQGQFLRGDATWATPTNTTYGTVTTAAAGLAPKLSGGTTSYLRGDGTWQVPPNTWTAFKGSTTTAAGTAGYVPAPASGAANRYFRCDGTWQVPPNTTYGNFTTCASNANGTAGLVPAPSSSWYSTRALVYLCGNGSWQYLDASGVVVNNLTTTAAHYALDARQGKTLNDKFANYIPAKSGTAAATTTNCPSGYVYYRYS